MKVVSAPGYYGEFARSESVTVKALDLSGRRYVSKGKILLGQARSMNRSLDGVLYVDRLESPDKLYKIEPEDETAEI